ncbi:hypothetical protein D1J60_00425 [Streptomyces sp. W1SF4]|nr:hypothetical protein D1J60_00425 [Streptomyces sp. W1SF4]
MRQWHCCNSRGPGCLPRAASASFRPLCCCPAGLRSHADRLVEQLASRALTSGKHRLHVRRDEEGRIAAQHSHRQ